MDAFLLYNYLYCVTFIFTFGELFMQKIIKSYTDEKNEVFLFQYSEYWGVTLRMCLDNHSASYKVCDKLNQTTAMNMYECILKRLSTNAHTQSVTKNTVPEIMPKFCEMINENTK